MARLRVHALLLLLALGAVTGCGGDPAGPGAAGEPADASPPLSDTTLPTIGGTPTPPKGPSDQIKPVTVRGRVELGAEPGCLELVAYPSRWVLLGEAVRDLEEGDEVEVVGLPSPQLRTGCDGVPLAVRELRAHPTPPPTSR